MQAKLAFVKCSNLAGPAAGVSIARLKVWPCLQVVYATVERSAVLSLLREHLQQNLVRIGRRWHRQKQGIPQVGGALVLSAACPANAA